MPVTTLDHAIGEFGPAPSFCKIDVEGWELAVLKGLSRPITLISFEYHLIEGGLKTVVACLECLGCIQGELSINVTPSECLEFAFPTWCSREEFLARFPGEFSGRNEFLYGDFFVRSALTDPKCRSSLLTSLALNMASWGRWRTLPLLPRGVVR